MTSYSCHTAIGNAVPLTTKFPEEKNKIPEDFQYFQKTFQIQEDLQYFQKFQKL
jgi:hypothetical protein